LIKKSHSTLFSLSQFFETRSPGSYETLVSPTGMSGAQSPA
jgi:hypothetical protein